MSAYLTGPAVCEARPGEAPVHLAGRAAQAALTGGEAAGVDPSTVGMLLVASEDDAVVDQSGVGRLLRAVGRPSTDGVSITGVGCGGLGTALRLLRGLVVDGELEAALLVLAGAHHAHDEPPSDGRADRAASCVVTDRPAGSCLRLLDVQVRSGTLDGAEDRTGPSDARSLRTHAVGVLADMVAEVLRTTGSATAASFSHLLLDTGDVDLHGFYADASGIDVDRVWATPSAPGGCRQADPLVNLGSLLESGDLRQGDRLLVLNDTAGSWSTIALEFDDGTT